MESDQSPAPLESLRNRFVEMQLAGDAAAALRLVETAGLKVGIDAETLLLHVIVPAQHRIGELWEQNRISVADEHQATAVSYVVASFLQSFLDRTAFGLASSFRPVGPTGAGGITMARAPGAASLDATSRFRLSVPSTQGRVLVACVEGEQHELGVRIAADLLIASGFDVSYLGCGASVQDIAASAQDPLVSVVALSITLPLHLMSLERVVRAVRRERPVVPILVGGAAATRATFTEELGIVVSSGTARDFVALVQRSVDASSFAGSGVAEVSSR